MNVDERAIGGIADRAPVLTRRIPTPYARAGGAAIDIAIFWLLMAGLAWVPFWNGSNELIAWGINAVLFASIAFLYEFSLLIRGASHPVGVRDIAVPAALFLSVLLWVYVQTAAWSHSGLSHPIWAMAADALGRPVEGSISVNRDLTNLALLRLVTAALVFWLSLQLCRDAKRARSLLCGIGVIGAGYAIYGLIAVSAPLTRLAWLDNVSADGLISSTFINRNSFAAYAGLGLVTIVGLTIQLYREEIRQWAVNRRSLIAAGIEVAGGRGAVLLGAGFLLSVALLLSGSRGGVSATGLALLVLIIASSWSKQRAALGAGLILGSVAATALLLVFGDPLIAGLRERGLGDINRLSVYLITMHSVLDAALLGQGYGSFIDIFPMYRDQSISAYGIWSQAHDTYLEVFQGLGLVFGSMLILSTVFLVFRCLKGATLRRDNIVPSIAIAAAALVGVHAVVDFGLQIQAVALTFAAILGAGVAQSKSSRLDLHD